MATETFQIGRIDDESASRGNDMVADRLQFLGDGSFLCPEIRFAPGGKQIGDARAFPGLNEAIRIFEVELKQVGHNLAHSGLAGSHEAHKRDIAEFPVGGHSQDCGVNSGPRATIRREALRCYRSTVNEVTVAHLAKVDPILRGVIQRIGPCTLRPERRRSPFESLVRAVAHQQLNGTAAATILGRFLALFPGRPFPEPQDLAEVPDAAIRAAGFSRAKLAAIRDIAAQALAGVLPTSRQITRLSDDEIVTRLTECRGVGRWTAEMLLIFKLGRPDVLPADDFGVRQGFMVAYGLAAQPKPKELLAHGECWAPYRTTAAWYLWRVADQAKPAKLAK